ncbi:unnamed protein product, partial [Musa acuminata var. zebrina]
DHKSQGSPTKGHITQNKEEKRVCPDEFLESSYFGSSVHYGARDFYTSSSSTQTSEIYRTDGGNNFGNKHIADRGEWWQGMVTF